MEKHSRYNENLAYKWADFSEDVGSIVLQLKDKKAEAVLAVAMGGISLGVALSRELSLPLYTVRVKSYMGRQRGDLYIGELPAELKGKSVFVADDIIDTKQTITGVCERLGNYNIKVVEKMVLCKREGVQENCVMGREIGRSVWVGFPWEYKS